MRAFLKRRDSAPEENHHEIPNTYFNEPELNKSILDDPSDARFSTDRAVDYVAMAKVGIFPPLWFSKQAM